MFKIPLVSWSGGLDSTANVIYYFSKKIPFETVYVKLANNEKQQTRELKSRKKILKKLTKIFGNYHIKDHVVAFAGPLDYKKGLIVQPFVWATAIAYNIDIQRHDKLVFGYIRHDDFWHVRQHFEKVIRLSCDLLSKRSTMPEIKYPLEWMDKKEIVQTFYLYDKQVEPLLKMITTCEGMGDCNNSCTKCKELESILKLSDKIMKTEVDKHTITC